MRVEPDVVVMSDELKSIYYQRQDVLLIEDGSLHTSDFESPSIAAIQSLMKAHFKTHGFEFMPELNVSYIEPFIIKKHLDTLSKESDVQSESAKLMNSESASRSRHIFELAVQKGASDIHIELFKSETRIEARIDGRLIELIKPIQEYEYGELLIGYLFNDVSVDKDEDFYPTKPNNGRLSLLLETNEGKRNTDWRISYIPAKDKGGQCTLRWLNKEVEVPKLDSLGWEPGHVDAMQSFMASASGICLIAGQVSSGKTTVIASSLNEMKRKGRSINTLEDPPEFDLGIIQTPVLDRNEDGFFQLAKLLLRHDVDIEMHGEIRDQKGAMSMCRKGETGQLMFSTLHTSSAVGIAHTLNEQMHVPTALVAAPDLMKLWIYQTLVRTLCPKCSHTLEQAKRHWSEKEKEQFEAWLANHPKLSTEDLRFRHKAGCEHCESGEKGRTSLVEMLVLDDEDRQYILSKDYLGWLDALKSKGYKTVADHANLKICRGDVDVFTAAQRVDGLFPIKSETVYHSFF
ncbi:GspE/PulE family protein [Vibrio maritimus]|uniref:GspE/PulE family protein n=1 Tax=Vibrio maritimus TaxID=990268 RepID=UPI001F3A67B6|nr:ATPase, T2SS/T4P/T4SS family [Vibrio maritimus]